MSTMTREKTWEKDGVTITFRPFPTQNNLTVAEVMTKAYRFPTPTRENPDEYSISLAVKIFFLAMPSIIKVECAEGAALWGEILKEETERPDFLEDPIADYKRLLKIAPLELLEEVDNGYLATREKAHLAPEALRKDPPEDPGLDLRRLAEEGPQDKSHPTIHGGGLLKKKSSPASTSSSQTAKKAK